MKLTLLALSLLVGSSMAFAQPEPADEMPKPPVPHTKKAEKNKKGPKHGPKGEMAPPPPPPAGEAPPPPPPAHK